MEDPPAQPLAPPSAPLPRPPQLQGLDLTWSRSWRREGWAEPSCWQGGLLNPTLWVRAALPETRLVPL